MRKKCQVVMLLINDDFFTCSIYKQKDRNTLVKSGTGSYSENWYIPQHLYITSGDVIKEGDWVYQTATQSIIQAPFDCKNDERFQKIIATTDHKLYQFVGYDLKDPKANKISEDFIEAYIKAYNEGKPIVDIEVECWGHEDYTNHPEGVSFGSLKLRKDGTIIIHPIKKERITEDDIYHLQWMYNRLINCHSENPEVDYMLEFKEIINKLK